jgi:hydroxymethylpyrimidine pyrophosphatase-like HAD family hydrolase
MRYLALACDYDGTLATGGRIDAATVEALRSVRAAGRRVVLVTGRRMPELRDVCPHLELFDRIVAENGAVLFRPAREETVALAAPPPPLFVAALHEAGVEPLAVGEVIVATWEPQQSRVLEAIRRLGLELQVIFNKGAVMVLPSGVNKASGLAAALAELQLSPHNAVGVGDAENDHAFLALCECAVAVSNALPTLQERSDWVTRGDHGAGVVELIEALQRDDLAGVASRLTRHHVPLGTVAGGETIGLPPAGVTALLAGPSGSGKSTLSTGWLERLGAAQYQYCIIDPEGDYESMPGAVVLGDRQRPPSVDAVIELLANPTQHAIVNLLGIAIEDRPPFFEQLLPRLQELRARTGRPHWIVVDEAHHLLPAAWDPSGTLPQSLDSLLLITVHPEHVAEAARAAIDTVIAVGRDPGVVLAAVPCSAAAATAVPVELGLGPGEAIVWSTHLGDAAIRINGIAPEGEHRRHVRKYAEGELGEDRSFYFRGAQGQLNLRAQNLALFMQLADGVDDETWLHHLAAGDYSRWLRDAVKDGELADEVAAVEAHPADPQASRRTVRDAIERRYTRAV